jgi:hypothetical protein
MHAALRLLLAGLITSGQALVPAAEPDTDGDGIPDAVEKDLGLLPEVPQRFTPIAASADAGYAEQEAGDHAPDILAVAAAHVGEQRVLIRTAFARSPLFTGSTFIIYTDIDADPGTGRVDPHHGGTDVMVSLRDRTLGLTLFGPCTVSNTGARQALVGNDLYVALDAPFRETNGSVRLGLHLLSQRDGGRSDSTPHAVVDLPRSPQAVPRLPLGRPGTSRSLSEFRYHNDKVAYEKLSDKGLRRDQVAPAEPLQFGRPRPLPTFAAGGRREAPGSVDLQHVPVDVLEEANVNRQAAGLTFGFPLPRGALYRLDGLRLLDGQTELPAQFAATVFWPDDSLKWVLIDATLPMRAKERRELTVEFGSRVRRVDAEQSLSSPVLVAGSELVLIDEHGQRFGGRLSGQGVLERSGPCLEVRRYEGRYVAADGATCMRWTARLSRRRASPLVQLALTHVNDCLENEFTDFRSLGLTVTVAGGLQRAQSFIEGPQGTLGPASPGGLVQWDDARLDSGPGRGAGVLVWEGGGAVVHDFWQRWPKAISATDGGLVFDLLPRQPGPGYGADLPYHLMYPFVEGMYRLKWGMSFTERISLDLTGTVSAEELWAEAQMPVVPVLPAAWYAHSRALGTLAAPLDRQFALWDEQVVRGFADLDRSRQAAREYGFLNYGDWFGERGRNWGNNEYDLPHGLFMHFARTGNRDAFRWALAGARHQADVDCVHAYPDPYYLGANHQHSIGHTGTWSEQPQHATWSYRYDFHTSADGGHTWADGMVDAWAMAGDARVMEAALGLGEHMAWGMSQRFSRLGTHERSAGWSLRALMALYRGTADPVYLEAARRIAAVPLREQQFDQGGAWPHVLPQDHAGGHQGAVGNNLFLIGVLLGGLQAYHEECQEPAVLRSLQAGVAWIAKSFDATVGGWPYSASPEGTSYYPAHTSLNSLIVSPLAYVGGITSDEGLMAMVDQAVQASVTDSAGGLGKAMAQRLFFTSEVLGRLQSWYAATRPDHGRGVLDGNPEMRIGLLLRHARSDRHGVRAPDQKVFFVRLRTPQAVMTATRTPHGSMTKRAESGTLMVYDAAGALVAEDHFGTDGSHEYACALPGAAGTQYKVVIDDDQRGVWTLHGEHLEAVMQLVPGFRIGGVQRSVYSFHVPLGATEFAVILTGVHTGPYEAVLLGPDGRQAEHFRGHNPGGALVAGAPSGPAVTGNPERGRIVVSVAPDKTGANWRIVLSAAMDIGVQLEGVPPFLSRTADEWFEPR